MILKKKDKDSKYTYKSVYTFVSSIFEARTTYPFLACLFNGLFYTGGNLFLYGRLIFHILDVEIEPGCGK